MPFPALPICRDGSPTPRPPPARLCRHRSPGGFPPRRHQETSRDIIELRFALRTGGNDDERAFPKDAAAACSQFQLHRSPGCSQCSRPAVPPAAASRCFLRGPPLLEVTANPKRAGPPHPTSAQPWLRPTRCSHHLDPCMQTATSAAAGRAMGPRRWHDVSRPRCFVPLGEGRTRLSHLPLLFTPCCSFLLLPALCGDTTSFPP